MLWIIVALLLAVPACLGFVDIENGSLVLSCLIGTAGIVGVFIASSHLANRSRFLWTTTAVLTLLLCVFVRMLFLGLIRFSGQGFGAEFFMHLEPASARVAWEQYRSEFIVFGLCVLALVAAFVFAARRAWKPQRKSAVIVMVVSVLLIVAGHAGLPEWRLGRAALEWYAPRNLSVPEVQMAAWRESPVVTTDIVTDQQLQARPAAVPKNLILLYIEAGGIALAPAKRYPGLMPNLEKLISEHSLVDHLHASSFVTIEGLVNTLCGTLYPFERGSGTMAGFDSMLERMPCLSDVLAAAGYQQTYLGGAEIGFAGKGHFLSVHGYAKVMGSVEWAKQGVKPRSGDWGVSDADLFEQSFAELELLKQSGRPFNLTLLTIGTHLPGFFYAECTKFRDGAERFLDAVHCTDELVGRWVQKLQKDGWLDANTVLVITGDHQIFPSAEMNRLFGADAVADVRLPLIVVGTDLPRPSTHHGAGYDLAPTVLDLLGVETNARFVLGRSLLRDDRKIDLLFSRFGDTVGEERSIPGDDFDCASAEKPRIPGLVPLSRCERDELSSILVAQATRYSAPLPQMRCRSAAPLHVMVPTVVGEPLQVSLSGSEQAERFIWMERPVEPATPGLYTLTMDKVGKVLERNFVPVGKVSEMPSIVPDLQDVAAVLMVWRPDTKPAALPEWLRQLGIDASGGSWVFSVSGHNVSRASAHAALGEMLDLSESQCETLLSDVADTSSR
ncbi:MAG: sulfatase-like hydrolase/transferase [Dokdonella sp.]